MNLQDGATIFLSIFVEALPFILLGTAVATYIKYKVRSETILKNLPKSSLGKCAAMSCLGIIFPVCECGNVPVLKGLLQKNVPPSAAISFLLGAPVLNPIVIITTMVAFPNNPEIWIARVGITFAIAVIIGYIFSFAKPEEIIKPQIIAKSCGHTHKPNKIRALDHFFAEAITMLSIITVGAAIAALSQTLIPRPFLIELASNQLLAIIVMMTVAFIISICSTTDAFFALAYSHIFGSSALVAFLVYGPMIDMKILLMLNNVLTKRAIIHITLLATVLTVISTYTWYNLAL